MIPSARILVVDDNVDLREVVVLIMKDEGYETFQAGSGNEALELLGREKVDLVISDIRMPNGTGIDLLKAAAQTLPQLPIIVFFSGFSDLTHEEAYALGAHGIIPKPWRDDELTRTVRNLLLSPRERWKCAGRSLEIEQRVEIIDTVCSLGKGGLFVPSTYPLPSIGSVISFSVCSDGAEILAGRGSVMWTRDTQKSGGERGYGLLFNEVNHRYLEPLIRRIEVGSPQAVIPNQTTQNRLQRL